ncbi:HNH endonuclease signature motif containing protein [Nocardioides aequoreus]|uniref:HNH endonuclease signature motif containing protein n=1 Tax=Nocardioides aequoreus TaxID=397278 RepID=UPI0004C37DD7|nr:HNH endonuclease signature motif containing protein [Nocardioides aequoreus]
MTETVAATPELVLTHPLAVLAQRLSERLDEVVAGPPVWSMPPAEQVATLATLAKVEAQLAALRLSVLVEAERSGAALAEGASSAADWAHASTRQRRSTARADLRLADLLCRYRHLEAGMLAGDVSLDQAKVIKRAIERFPQDGPHGVTCDQAEAAERHLVELAASFAPEQLEVLGEKIYEVIAPEVAEAAEGERLARQEARAERRTSLRMWRDGEGVTHGRFAIPDLHGAMLTKALQAIASPARAVTGVPDGSGAGTGTGTSTGTSTEMTAREPVETRRGRALCELLERMGARDLPVAGGGDATVVVRIDAELLTDTLHQAGVATLDTGLAISAGEARRLACGHRLLPAVLGTGHQALDLGDTARLFSKAQRVALTLRDGGCTAEHCDVPASMCHAHHDRPWSHGGTTDLANGRLLCGPHHRRIHDPGFDHVLTPDNQVRFHRRE